MFPLIPTVSAFVGGLVAKDVLFPTATPPARVVTQYVPVAAPASAWEPERPAMAYNGTESAMQLNPMMLVRKNPQGLQPPRKGVAVGTPVGRYGLPIPGQEPAYGRVVGTRADLEFLRSRGVAFARFSSGEDIMAWRVPGGSMAIFAVPGPATENLVFQLAPRSQYATGLPGWGDDAPIHVVR